MHNYFFLMALALVFLAAVLAAFGFNKLSRRTAIIMMALGILLVADITFYPSNPSPCPPGYVCTPRPRMVLPFYCPRRFLTCKPVLRQHHTTGIGIYRRAPGG